MRQALRAGYKNPAIFYEMNPNEKTLERILLSDALHRAPGASKNGQGSLHQYRRVQGVTKRVLGRHSQSGAPHLRPNVVKNSQGSSHSYGRMRGVRKLVQGVGIRLGSWNIGSLTGKLRELADTFIRRRIQIACLQETKWVGEKAKEVDDTDFKLWYTGSERSRNGVGIMIDKSLRDGVVNIKRKGDRIIGVKLMVEDLILNVLSVYAPQIGSPISDKIQFWEDFEGDTRR